MQISARAPDLQGEAHYIYLAATDAPTLKIPVQFADYAAKVFCVYRERYQFGASGMKARCGNIYNSSGVLAGKISYNGRIWDAEGHPVE